MDGGRTCGLRLRRLPSAGIALAASALAMAGDALAVSPDVPYSVVDGKVDARTYDGFRRYNAACNHCHGPDGAGGSFGPSLIAAPLPADRFRDAVLAGRSGSTFVMKGYAGDPNVEPYIDAIYAYLRGRADGAIGRGRPLRAEQR